MNLDTKIIDYLLSKASFIGLLTLYFIKLRFDKKQGFSQSDLEKIRTGEYTYGYFIACASFGLFEYTDNKGIINITVLNEYLSSKILEKLTESAKEHDALSEIDKAKNPLLIVYKWVDDIKRIENI